MTHARYAPHAPAPAGDDAPAIEVRGLTMQYGSRVIMRDLNFTVARGEVFVLMGGSGSGKSTLLKHLIGLKAPAKGTILFEGEQFDLDDDVMRKRVLRRIGVLYQNGALWSGLTLAENVALPLEEFTELDATTIAEVVSLKLALVGLRGFEDFYPSAISGGMRKRAALARAIALDPDVLFFDEPSSGLDPISASRLDDLILELKASFGTTIVVVTHDLDSIFRIADRALFLDIEQKTMTALGPPAELRDNPPSAEVHQVPHPKQRRPAVSRRANPTRIGLFLLGALVIAIVGTAVLASATWFQQREKFISFFPETVNGLENGAPVKFQGVPVGTVNAIDIRIDQRDNSFQVPVEYDIDLRRLTTPSGTYVNLADTVVLRQQIAKGLRAQLQMESFVTGVLYLELSYRTDSTPPKLEAQAKWPEIPSTPSLMAALGGGAGSLLTEIMRILNRVNGMLGDVNMKEMNAAVVQSAKAVEALVGSPELRATLRQMPGATAQLNRTLAEAEKLVARATGAIDPMQTQITGVSTEAIATLQALRKTLDETHGLISADTGPGYALTGALTSLREAADALKLLITSLERNPDMLIRGKKTPEE